MAARRLSEKQINKEKEAEIMNDIDDVFGLFAVLTIKEKSEKIQEKHNISKTAYTAINDKLIKANPNVNNTFTFIRDSIEKDIKFLEKQIDVFQEQRNALEEQRNALDEQENALEEQRNALDEQENAFQKELLEKQLKLKEIEEMKTKYETEDVSE